jgi:hypothetical protein
MGQRESPIHVVLVSSSEVNPLLHDLLVFIPSQLALVWTRVGAAHPSYRFLKRGV